MGNYHFVSFVPGFNLWYVAAPVMLVFIAWVATGKYRLTAQLKIRRQLGEKVFKTLATVASILFNLLLVGESSAGVEQLMLNRLITTGDSPVWAALLTPAILATIAVSYGYLAYVASVVVGNLQVRRLKADRRRYLAQVAKAQRRWEYDVEIDPKWAYDLDIDDVAV